MTAPQKSVYLAGAIEFAPDEGRSWRDDMVRFLKDELGMEAFNPSRREHALLNEEEKEHFRTWKKTDPVRFKPVIKRIIDADLRQLLHKTSFIIVLWDKYSQQGTGTSGELTMACHNEIPIYMVLAEPIENTSSWILGCATEVFHSFNELKTFLKAEFAAPRG